MLRLTFSENQSKSLNILCLGAHSDDIEIGCGGTILSMLEKYSNVTIYWVVFAASTERRAEAENSAHVFLAKAANTKVVIKDFRESYFPYTGSEVKEYFELLKNEIDPDVIFTHYQHDLHQDHRLVSELTWNTYRDHLILEYEIVKYDGDLGTPNLFVHLNEEVCNKKIRYLKEHFKSQQSHHWFTEEAFRSILRIRGIESNAPSRYAEGFYCRKIVL